MLCRGGATVVWWLFSIRAMRPESEFERRLSVVAAACAASQPPYKGGVRGVDYTGNT